MNSQVIHIKREFWEHRSLWIAPAIWAGVGTLLFAWLIFFVIPGHVGHDGILMEPDSHAMAQLSESDRREVQTAIAGARDHTIKTSGDENAIFAFSYLAITLFVSGFACVVVFFYLIDCLYTERRDRSILFWKSLPISDAQVVLSKLAVALVVVPLGAIVLAAVMQLLMVFMVWARFHGTAIAQALPDLTVLSWLESQVIALVVAVAGVLWYAPIAGYLLLMSSWARRNVFLWVVLPPAALAALEAFFFHSTHVMQFIGWRFIGYIELLHLDTKGLNVGSRDGADAVPHVGDVLSTLDFSSLFLNAEVWIALLVTAAMVFAAIRLRRYRDES